MTKNTTVCHDEREVEATLQSQFPEQANALAFDLQAGMYIHLTQVLDLQPCVISNIITNNTNTQKAQYVSFNSPG